MSAKADWFSGIAAETNDSDPFAAYSGGEMGTTVATPPTAGNLLAVPGPAPVSGPDAYWLAQEFTMETPIEVLEDRVRLLVEREGNLDAAGVTCPLKEMPDMTCSACPYHEVGRDTSKSALCRLGKEQERLVALVLAQAVDGPKAALN